MVSGQRDQAEADPESKKKREVLLPEPLTRRGYKRRPVVEGRITEALTFERDSFLENVRRRDEKALNYFPPEGLVFFIRRAARTGDKRLVNTLFQELCTRCLPNLHGRIRGFSGETRQEIIQEIFARIAAVLLEPCDKADFAEVSFWIYLKTLTIDVCRERDGEVKRPERSLDENLVDTDGEKNGAMLTHIADDALSPEQEMILKEGLEQLPLKLRNVFIMAHKLEMKIESKDPNEMTISRHFNVSEKTVRNWLKEVETLLVPFREDRNE